MPAPVVIEIAPNPAREQDFAQALVDGCSRARGAGGCVLGTTEMVSGEVRAWVIVSFWDGYSRVRIEAVTPSPDTRARARELSFRDEDPLPERFRATGLVAAGLVSDLEAATPRGPPDADGARAPAVEAQPRGADKAPERSDRPARASSLALSAAGLLGLDGLRPRVGVWLGADVPLGASAAYATWSVSYEETWRPDERGITESFAGVALGAGARTPRVVRALALRGWAQLELEDLHVSILQPGTGRHDSGNRIMLGAVAGGDVIWPLDETVGVFSGARVAWLGGDTTIRVQDKPAAVLPGWAVSLALGLDLRLP
jgi:hypothetical protein